MEYGEKCRVINLYNENAAAFGKPFVVCKRHLEDLKERFRDMALHVCIGNQSRVFDEIAEEIEHPCHYCAYDADLLDYQKPNYKHELIPKKNADKPGIGLLEDCDFERDENER